MIGSHVRVRTAGGYLYEGQLVEISGSAVTLRDVSMLGLCESHRVHMGLVTVVNVVGVYSAELDLERES